MPYLYLLVLLLTLVNPLFADPNRRDEVGLDIYNRDQALVREIRHLEVSKGPNRVDFISIAPGIFGHTAHVAPLERNDRIASHSLTYNFDLATQEKLLDRFLGRWFSFSSDDDDYAGRLLRYDADHLFLQPDTTDPTLEVVARTKLNDMFYPALPAMLFLEPTLRWDFDSDKKIADLPVELTYLTGDISWSCDYRAELLGDDSLALSGAFTIANDLPLDFPNAKIALVAGWTTRGDDPEGDHSQRAEDAPNDDAAKAPPNGDERLFEYYRYPLDRPLDLFASQTIEAPFFESRGFKAAREFVFPHLLENGSVRTRLKFDNTALAERPLPEGYLGLYRRAADGSLAFIGENYVAATPVGGKVELDVGVAFDLTAKRTRVAQLRPDRNRHEETWKVEITSGRAASAEVLVEQRVFGYYTIERATVADKPVEARTKEADLLQFPVLVPAGGSATLEFTLSYGY